MRFTNNIYKFNPKQLKIFPMSYGNPRKTFAICIGFFCNIYRERSVRITGNPYIFLKGKIEHVVFVENFQRNMFIFLVGHYISKYVKNKKIHFEKTQNNDLFISPNFHGNGLIIIYFIQTWPSDVKKLKTDRHTWVWNY